MILDELFRLGIPTYTMTINTAIPVNGKGSFPIGKDMPQQIGRIYGISFYTDGVTSDGSDLITTNDAFNLFLTFKIGSSDFFETVRLIDAVSIIAGSPVPRPMPFMQVNVPNAIDLSTSQFVNPTLITAGANNKTIAMQIWYVSTESYNTMVDKKIVLINAKESEVQARS